MTGPEIRIARLRRALIAIANQDYRGNRHASAAIAREALEDDDRAVEGA